LARGRQPRPTWYVERRRRDLGDAYESLLRRVSDEELAAELERRLRDRAAA
jgi:hypothetical protein